MSNKGTSYANSRERNEKFSQLCELVCPGFLKRAKEQNAQVARTLCRAGYDLDDLLRKAQKFKDKYPDGKQIKGKIPVNDPNTSNNEEVRVYKKQASEFIRKTIKLDIPVDIAIPRTFYSEIIKYCMKKK